MTSTYLTSAVGGALIGLSAATFLVLNGRVAGISGLAAGVLRRPSRRWVSNVLFVGGLLLGPPIYRAAFGAWPQLHFIGSLPLLAIAGLLVGFGTRLGSGCTSGHGVCGLARLSPRSLVAVPTFLATGALTVLLMRTVS
jgi:uncharacterized membrane protein YedE/YeeE